MKKKVITIIIMFILIYLLTGCTAIDADGRKCVKYEKETYFYYNVVLKLPMTGVRSVCVQYEGIQTE